MNDLDSASVGRISRILNRFRSSNKYNGTSFGFFYLTNECNYSCDMCYMNSLPGLKNTRLNIALSLGIMREFNGIDEIILSGGEISTLPYFEEQIRAASHAAVSVVVFTNGTGFLKKSNGNALTCFDSASKLVDDVKQRMEKNLLRLPSNVEVVLPLTEFHLIKDATRKAHRFHEEILQAGALLAKEWLGRTDRPKIRFIVKNTPGNQHSGAVLISKYGIEGLGTFGASFPGEIAQIGRGVKFESAIIPPKTKASIDGGCFINYEGVFASDSSLLQKLHTRNWTAGQICSIETGTTVDSVVQSIEQYVLKGSETMI